MRKLTVSSFLLGLLLLAAPASADPQFGIFFGRYDGWKRPAVLAVVHVPLIEYKRLGVGPCGGAGVVFDNDDRNRFGKTHAHLALAGCGAANLRLGSESDWNLTAGLGRAWIFPEKVRDHAPNFNFFMIGLTKSF